MLEELNQSNSLDFNTVDYLGRAPIHVAAGPQGCISMCEYLLKEAINLDQLDAMHRSALYLAIMVGKTDVVNFLQSKGATVIAKESVIAEMLCRVGFEGDI